MSPIANGILVVPSESEFIIPALDGMKLAIAIPKSIAKNIQSVRYWSRKLSFFLFDAGAQFDADIILFYL